MAHLVPVRLLTTTGRVFSGMILRTFTVDGLRRFTVHAEVILRSGTVWPQLSEASLDGRIEYSQSTRFCVRFFFWQDFERWFCGRRRLGRSMKVGCRIRTRLETRVGWRIDVQTPTLPSRTTGVVVGLSHPDAADSALADVQFDAGVAFTQRHERGRSSLPADSNPVLTHYLKRNRSR